VTNGGRYGLGGERLAAFERLGLEPSADATSIKQAYRRATLAHPPDTDADGFREVRAAYELLADPWSSAREQLSAITCHAEPPAFAEHEPALRHALALDLLRAAVGRIDARLLVDGAREETS
jgi:curved DNA-binding protein CbpA